MQFPTPAASNIVLSKTLANVFVLDGEVRLDLPADVQEALDSLAKDGGGDLRCGQTLTDPDRVNKFLASVMRFYQKRPSACRFDYRLTYKTSDDYHYARRRFEQFFYAERLTQVTDAATR